MVQLAPEDLISLGTRTPSIRASGSTRSARALVSRELSLVPGTAAGPGPEDTAELRSAESELLGRARLAERFSALRDGIGYGGRRDYYRLLGYKERLLPQDYRARYKRGGIAERCVEAYPKATWSGGASIVEDPDPNNVTEFEDKTTSLCDRLAIWKEIIKLDIQTGLGRYAAFLIGTGDKDLSEPLKPGSLSGPEDIIYITPLTEDRAQIQQSVTDTTDPRFGLPEYYMCYLGIPAYSMTEDDVGPYGGASHAVTKRVHHTRIIHSAEQCLFDKVFGKPRLRAVWNYLDDLLKVSGGGAEASWQRVDPGININIDKDLRVTKEELTSLREMVEAYQHGGITRFLPTRGGEVKMLNALVDKWGPNQDAITRLICAVLGIPHRVLMGSERGEMASTQDRDNWSDRVAERRQEFGIPLVRAFISRLQEFGALPSVDDYEVQWPDEEELNEQEKGALLLTYAQANHNNGVPIITANEMRDQVLGMPPIEPQVPTDANGNPIPVDPAQVAADGSTDVPGGSDRPLNNTPTAGDTSGTSGAPGTGTGAGATGSGGPTATDQQRMVQPDLVVGDPGKVKSSSSSVIRVSAIRFASSGKVVPIAKIRSAEVRRLVATKLSTQRRLRRNGMVG